MKTASAVDKPLKSALKPRSRGRRVTIELYALVSSSFIWACGQWLLAPTLPYFAMEKGADAFQFAMISSAYAACQMISSPLLGVPLPPISVLSDKIGRRPVLLIGLGATTVLYVLMSFVRSVLELLLARAALGFFSGTAAAEVAYIADLTSRTERQGWIKLQSTLQTAGCLLGPAVGGILAPYSARQMGEDSAFEHLCHAMAMLCLINFVIGAFFFTPPPPCAPKTSVSLQEPLPHKSLRAVLRSSFTHPTTGPLLVAGFLDCFSLAVSDGPEAYFLRDQFSFGPAEQAKFMMTCSASSLIWGSVVTFVGEALPAKAACVIFSFGSACVMVILMVVRAWWAPYAYAVLFGFTVTVVEVASKTTLLGRLVPESQQGAMFGIESALINLGFSLGPLIGGSVYEDTHRALPYTISSLCFCCSALVYSSLPSSASPGGVSLLDAADSTVAENPQALEHLSNKVPLPGKRFGARLATEKARRVFFVCPDLYDKYRAQVPRVNSSERDEDDDPPPVQKSNTMGEERFSQAVADWDAMRDLSKSGQPRSHSYSDVGVPS
eukprot:gb/GFBE01048060.1/.p1 GENE.gb/GFBE01048060.1/~~gb/GFBE01048060.1/.p1  ORF type:complete len:552 (+),score=82.91 gb/GFBE01048060.1/:1-1656(+)